MTTLRRSKKRIRRTYLSRSPQDLGERAWFYEERRGLYVVIYPEPKRGCGAALIPWRKIEASRKRFLKEKRAKATR
jgi:hypothetical protein